MTSLEITSRIQTLQAEIKSTQAIADKYKSDYNSWLTASKRPCNFSRKKNKQKCAADRARELNIAKARLALSVSNNATVQRKTAELNTLRDTMASNNAQAESLADKGIVYAAEVIEAQGSANATQIKAASEAEAITSEADSEKNQKTIIVVVVSIVVLAIVFIYVKSKLN